MKGDVKVIVSGSSGHIVFDEKSLIKRILMYVISAILGFGALFLAIMMDSRAYAATLPEIFMGAFEDAYIDILKQCVKLIPENVVIHRLTGDGDKRILIAPLWSGNKKHVWNRIQNEVLKGCD